MSGDLRGLDTESEDEQEEPEVSDQSSRCVRFLFNLSEVFKFFVKYLKPFSR